MPRATTSASPPPDTPHDGTEYALGCRGLIEVEAESVAYVVATAAGLATDAYSLPYVAQWAEGNVNAIKATASRHHHRSRHPDRHRRQPSRHGRSDRLLTAYVLRDALGPTARGVLASRPEQRRPLPTRRIDKRRYPKQRVPTTTSEHRTPSATQPDRAEATTPTRRRF